MAKESLVKSEDFAAVNPNHEVKFANQKIESLVLGRKVRMAELQSFVLQRYRSTRFRDAIRIEAAVGEAWLFDYGSLVLWGVGEDDKQRLFNQLLEFAEAPYEKPEFEIMRFSLDQPEPRISIDHLYLNSNSELSRLAASHAIAQSVKLNVFEAEAQRAIENSEYIPHALAKTGRIPLRRKQLAKRRGELFSTRSDILLNYNLLDSPEFFWDYPELEPIYTMVARYLEIVPRTNLLAKKLETMHELLEMMASERNHQHSAFLEWIIIVLIAVDIIVYFLE